MATGICDARQKHTLHIVQFCELSLGRGCCDVSQKNFWVFVLGRFIGPISPLIFGNALVSVGTL